MAANGVKMEPGLVKSEPGMGDLDMADIDEVGYEDDTGELIFPHVIPEGWLVRLPKELWSTLAHLDDDEEIDIGEIRIWEDVQSVGTKKQTVRFNLRPQLAKRDLRFVPKQYDLTKQVKSDLKNTFVFSEKNLPGFKPKNTQGGRGQDILRSVDSSEGPVKVTRRGPRTIPKRTEYVASTEAEYVCTPRDNAEFRRINWEKQHAKDSVRTSFVATEKDAQSLHKQGMKISTGDEDFINTGAPKRRPQDNKATRMPRPALIDALERMFKRYKFWPMSALKQELEQPEAYLKDVLKEIAVLVKTGRAANHYMLKAENAMLDEAGGLEPSVKAEDFAPDVKGEDDDGEQELEFEDA